MIKIAQAQNQANANQVSSLTDEEKTDLRNAETSIRTGLKSYHSIGRALNIISIGRLYRAKFPTFEKYLDEKWDMTPARASQYQSAARIHDLLTTAGIEVLPATESQCRPFARLPINAETDSRILAIWSACITAGERVTAKLIDEAVTVDLVDHGDKELPTTSPQDGENSLNTGKAPIQNDPKAADTAASIAELIRKVAHLESALEAARQERKRLEVAKGVPANDLAKELFRTGYRAMVKKYHPEYGGSAETLAQLEEIKATLGI